MEDNSLKGKTVLVTGGTGTFGRAFVSKILSIPEVRKIIVFSRDEFKQSEMQNEIKDSRIRFFLGDVRDAERLDRALSGVDVVVHAAALKQVPALEYNPLEAIKTNILGTQNIVSAALNNNVEKVLLISSDKAVHPVNLYGATKLCAEKIFIAANAYRGAVKPTKFSVVRYGNVIGSRGSLVDVIKRARPSGVVKLTDERMTRFWISVDTIMEIIVEMLVRMRGGEVFVPKMRALRIADVISTLAPECRIEVIGVRPGEKMNEALLTDHEVRRTRDLGNVWAVLPEFVSDQRLEESGLYRHYQKFPAYPESTVYISNNPEFLLSKSEVARVLET